MLALPGLIGLAGGCKVDDKHAPDGGTGDAGSAGPVDTQAPDTMIDSGAGCVQPQRPGDVPVLVQRSDRDVRVPGRRRARTDVPLPVHPHAADGPHSFSVRAVDAAGNGDDTPAERVWTIDTVPPDTTLTDAPPAADNSVMAQFSFRSNEQGVSFDCSLDNAGYLPCTSGALFGPVGDGPHSFAVRARDRAGNIDLSPAVYAWTVDTRTPDTQILPAARADRP